MTLHYFYNKLYRFVTELPSFATTKCFHLFRLLKYKSQQIKNTVIRLAMLTTRKQAWPLRKPVMCFSGIGGMDKQVNFSSNRQYSQSNCLNRRLTGTLVHWEKREENIVLQGNFGKKCKQEYFRLS